MVFNVTFNNISVIQFTDKTTHLQHGTDKLYHIMLYQEHIGIIAVGDYTDCIGSCKSS